MGAIRTGAGSSRRLARRSRGLAPLHVDISIEDIVVCVNGGYVEHDAAALTQAVQRDEVEYEVVLPGDGAEAERYFSDLGHEYVTINAEYTT